MSSVTRGLSCNDWSNFFPTASPVTYLPTVYISIRLFVFNLLLLSVWRTFYPHLSWRDFSFKRSSNKTVTFVAIYPKQLFIVRCPTFLFSKRVRSLVGLWIYFNCGKCLAVKLRHFYGPQECKLVLVCSSPENHCVASLKVYIPFHLQQFFV